MAKVKSVSLREVESLGAIKFVRAEWKGEGARGVLIRYAVDDELQGYGLRLDMDKIVILDSLREAGIELTKEIIQDRTEAIWRIVAKHRSGDRAFTRGSSESTPIPS